METPDISMTGWYMCQMDKRTIFQVREYQNKCRVLYITEKSSDKFNERAMLDYPGEAREYPSLCKTSEEHAFLIGG